MISPTVWFGIMAAVPAVLAEYLYTRWPPWLAWWQGLPIWLPLQLVIGYAIFRMVTTPGVSLLDAFVIWAACTAGLRILVSCAILGQEIKTGTWIAFGLILAAQVVRAFWEKWVT